MSWLKRFFIPGQKTTQQRLREIEVAIADLQDKRSRDRYTRAKVVAYDHQIEDLEAEKKALEEQADGPA